MAQDIVLNNDILVPFGGNFDGDYIPRIIGGLA